MNIYDMLSVYNPNKVVERVVQQPTVVNKVVEETIPQCDRTDDEINEILSYLLELNDKYFKEIPLSQDLCKNFIWNLPKNIFNMFKDSCDYGEPDAMNILLLFYPFCMDNVSEAYPMYLSILSDMLKEVDNEISEGSIAYTEMMDGVSEIDDGEDKDDYHPYDNWGTDENGKPKVIGYEGE